ncbi:MAG: stage III sporulation protein AC [Clostridia bacterium]|nr:stage III sporulation protein AC [Clostridia bacterium]
MSVDLVFRIAAIGIVVAVLAQLLSRSGREDMATMVTIAGLVIVLFMVIELVSNLFENIKQVFNLY